MFKTWSVGREVATKYRSQVVVELKFQHGDADGETTEEIRVSHKDVVPFANFLSLCMNTSSESHGGPGYTDLPGYEEFGEGLFPPDLHYAGMATLIGYEFFYYNAHGMKSCVNLEA